MYPQQFQKSLEIIKNSREKNLSYTPRKLSEEEKDDILTKYHPNYKKDGFSALKIGANAGERVPNELCSALQAKSILIAGDIDLSSPDYDTDVLIIGGGGAGCCSAIEAKRAGCDVLIATKLRIGDSNTIMAEGGIQAAESTDDSPALHFIDTFGGGHFAAKKSLVSKLVLGAPDALLWLNELGVEFDRDESGNMLTTHGGGTSKKRMHFAKDLTGLEIMRTLRDEVKSLEIPVIDYSPAVELVLDENKNVSGAVLFNLDTKKYILVRAKTVVIATGGSGRMHFGGFPTSNHYGATADGLVLAYRAGAKLVFPGSMQYHPTGAAFPNQIFGALVTEKARALGAKLVNSRGEVFINPLETRDVVAAAIIRQCETKKGVCAPGVTGVWLDTPMIEKLNGAGSVEKHLPSMFKMFARYEIDIRKEPAIVYPTLHYQNGGIDINGNAECTGLKNLYVAGEAAGGIHGLNRLMGNSLLDIVVFGRIAGKNAANAAKLISLPKHLTLWHIDEFDAMRKGAGITDDSCSPLLLPDYRYKESEI